MDRTTRDALVLQPVVVKARHACLTDSARTKGKEKMNSSEVHVLLHLMTRRSVLPFVFMISSSYTNRLLCLVYPFD